jgi:hypothetical protein
MKKKLIPEPLLNTIARQVGRAAGTIVRASKLAIPDGIEARYVEPNCGKKENGEIPSSKVAIESRDRSQKNFLNCDSCNRPT